ncbi:MAG: fused MFS/spermidine synthase [Candidatus Gastranaerophilales bacterium]|nr:fused MFS/spermidine synthase [Candidatus Gastranaerophilales bacterium]
MLIYPDIEVETSFAKGDEELFEKFLNSEKELFSIESDFNEIKIVENKAGKFMKFNDAYQAGIVDYNGCSGNLPHMNYFLIPFFMNLNIKNVLILGLGSGRLVKDILSVSNIVNCIDIVEIDDKVINISKDWFGFEENEKTKVHLQDARVFVRNSKKKYDLIILDIFSNDGMPYRFMTEEFLEEISKILSKRGLIGANIFSHSKIDSEKNIIFKSMLKTYQNVYKEILIFPSMYGDERFYTDIIELSQKPEGLINIILFASKSKLQASYSYFEKNINVFDADKVEMLKLIGIDNYLQDLYNGIINVKSVKILKDEYEKDKSFEKNILNYLKTG